MSCMKTLTDDEIIRHADSALDPLTSTELEVELLRRLTRLKDEMDDASTALDALDDAGFDLGSTKDIEKFKAVLKFGDDYNVVQARDLMEAAGDHDIYTAAQLTKRLDLASQYEDAANDAAEAISKLNALFPITN